jgi:uracil phosphoribosyltransferase
LVSEACRGLRTATVEIDTPLETITASELDDRVVAIPILRAGLGMLEAVTDSIPGVSVGYVGLERDEMTAVARTYYEKLPSLDRATVLLLDPMLATGGSARYALERIFAAKPHHVSLVCVVAAPEGIDLLTNHFPELQIVTAAIDRGLNNRKYILPGLGDYGDRLYGT